MHVTAANWSRLGLECVLWGPVDKGIEAFANAIATLEAIRAIEPHDYHWHLDLYRACLNLADVLFAVGRNSEALATYRRTLPILDDIGRTFPQDEDRRWLLSGFANTHCYIASVLDAQGRYREALTEYLEAIASMEARAAHARTFEELVARLRSEIADFHLKNGFPAAAVEELRRVVKFEEARAGQWPQYLPHLVKARDRLNYAHSQAEEHVSKTSFDEGRSRSVESAPPAGREAEIREEKPFQRIVFAKSELTEPLLRTRDERIKHFSGRMQWSDAVKGDPTLKPLVHIDRTYPDRRRGLLRPDLRKIDPSLAQALTNWLNYKRADGSKPNSIPIDFGLMTAAEWYSLLEEDEPAPTGAQVFKAVRRGDANADELGRRQSAAQRRLRKSPTRPRHRTARKKDKSNNL